MALQDLTPQLRTRLRKVEWMVVLFLGGTTLLMLASLGWFIFRTGEARGWWVDEVPYYTYVADATGIKVGTPVHMMGFKVGEVTKVDALPLDQLRSWPYLKTNQFRAFVGFKVRDKEPSRYPGYISSDSRVKLGGFPVEIAGGVVLEISVGSMSGTLTTTNLEGGRIGVLSHKFAYDELEGKKDSPNRRYLPLSASENGYYLPLDQSETLLAQVQQVLAKVRGIGTQVDAALPGLTAELYLTLTNVHAITAQLRPNVGPPGALGAMVLPTNLVARFGQAGGLGDLILPTNLVARFGQPGGLGDLILPTHLNAQLTATLAAVPGTLSNLDQRTASLGALITNLVKGTAPLGNAITNLDLTMDDMRSNTVPQATALLRTLDSFVEGMKRHWLFRGAFKAPKAEERPAPRGTNSVSAAPSRARF